MMSCKATCVPFTALKPVHARPAVIRAVRCSASVPSEPSQTAMSRRSVGALLAGVPLLFMSSGAARADVGDAIKSADPSVATGNIPKIGDSGEGGPPGDVGKAIAEGARGATVPDPLKTVQGGSTTKPGMFGGGPKVPTFGSFPGKNSIVEKALTDNSPAKQFNQR